MIHGRKRLPNKRKQKEKRRVVMMVALGAMAWVLLKFGFEASPIVLGLILGPIAEQGFVQGYLIGNASGNIIGEFFGRPISIAIIGFTLLTLLWPLWSDRKARATLKGTAND